MRRSQGGADSLEKNVLPRSNWMWSIFKSRVFGVLRERISKRVYTVAGSTPAVGFF